MVVHFPGVRKWQHWSEVWDMLGAGHEDNTTMSMTSFQCLCCLLWRCFILPSAVSIFDFGHVGVSGVLFVVNT